MNKYFHYFGHCEMWFELNSWVEGNKSAYVIAVTVLYARSEEGGGEEKQLTMYDVAEPEDLGVHVDTNQRNHEAICSTGC